MIEARLSRFEDIEPIASDIRPEDAEEVVAAGRADVFEALRLGLEMSDECFTIYQADASEQPLAMFGYKVTDPGICGVIWMLGANGLMRHRYEFLRKSNYWVDYIQAKTPLMYNLVYEKNTVHIRWLKWLGFSFVRQHEHFGPKDLPFIEFARLRHV